MDIALFFIFLICDLIIVPICWFSYGKQGEYREGMVMGVHIPSHAVEDPEVRKICGKIQKHWNRFHQINLLLSVLICFLCFYNFILFIIVWSVWLAEYVAVLYTLIIVPHRQMYRLKLQRGVDFPGGQWIFVRSGSAGRLLWRLCISSCGFGGSPAGASRTGSGKEKRNYERGSGSLLCG